jgi:hypothetical protein
MRYKKEKMSDLIQYNSEYKIKMGSLKASLCKISIGAVQWSTMCGGKEMTLSMAILSNQMKKLFSKLIVWEVRAKKIWIFVVVGICLHLCLNFYLGDSGFVVFSSCLLLSL